MIPYLAWGDDQAIVSLFEGKRFGNGPYPGVHAGNGGPNPKLWSGRHGINNPWNVPHHQIFLGSPFLDGEMLNLDMTGTCSGPVFVDHCNGSFIVNVQWGRTSRRASSS